MTRSRRTHPGRPAPWTLVCLCAIACCWPASPALAYEMNGFLPAAGQVDLALSYTSESYDEFWRGETRVSTPPVLGEVETRTLTLWGRYGVTDRLAVVVNLPYVEVEADGTGGLEDSGIADLTALAQLRLVDFGDGHTLTGGAGVRSDVGGYKGDAPVSLGDASTDLLLRLVYQFQRGAFYVSQQVGFDLRSDEVPDGIPLHTEVGYGFASATVNAFYTRYFADGGTDIGDAGFSFPSNQEEYERVGGKILVRAGRGLGAFASAHTTLDGRNTGDSTGFSLGGVVSF